MTSPFASGCSWPCNIFLLFRTWQVQFQSLFSSIPEKSSFHRFSPASDRKAPLPWLCIIMTAHVETSCGRWPCISSRIRHHCEENIIYTVKCLILLLGIALELPVFSLVQMFGMCFAPCSGVRDKARHKAVRLCPRYVPIYRKHWKRGGKEQQSKRKWGE